ncbi:MAG: hypothetical protein M1524_03210 [Patescibacteria group bacterium]|nr:hypothetical protein [Patescibacteria group bacterium]
MLFFQKSSKKRYLSLLVIISLVLTSYLVYRVQAARADALTSAYVKVTDSRPSATTITYVTGWTFPSTDSIECMNIVFSTAASGGSVPTAMTTTSAAKVSISGGGLTANNWTLYNTANGTLQYENDSGEASTATAITITTSGITNSSSAGIYYAQITTYSTLNTHTCSTAVDSVVAAFSIKAGQALSVTVDPSLTFAINGVASSQSVNGSTTTAATVTDANTIPLGNVNSTTNAIAAHDLVVTTNAQNGYTVYASYSGTLTDPSTNTIADWTGTNGAPSTFSAAGTSAFGYTTESTTLSGTGGRFSGGKWAKFETWGYEVARSATKPSAPETTRVGYQVGVSGTQASGTYTTTIIFVATPTY